MFRISVIIPSYNRCSMLRRALASVFSQDYSPIEVIVIDDGSTDDSRLMVATLFPTVRYYYQPNLGVSAARNAGIKHATGNWIAFLDSDDEWLPGKLNIQQSALSYHPEIKICHTEEVWIRNGKRVNPMNKHKKSTGWIFKQCLPLCAMSPSSILIHCTIFEEIGDFDESLPACEDYDLWLKITAKYPVLLIEQPQIIKYGGHGDQLSSQYWGMDRFRIYALERIISRGVLETDDKTAAIEMLLKKCHIYRQGALKRNKHHDAAHYQQIIEKYSFH